MHHTFVQNEKPAVLGKKNLRVRNIPALSLSLAGLCEIREVYLLPGILSSPYILGNQNHWRNNQMPATQFKKEMSQGPQ